MTEVTLKTCPCCDGKAVVDYGSMHEYICKKKGIKLSGVHEVRCTECGLSTGWQLNAAERWNRRIKETTCLSL